jgi:hypothetical protein
MLLPASARVCAFDLDECTITVAFDTEEEVRRAAAVLPAGHRKVLSEISRLRNDDPQKGVER